MNRRGFLQGILGGVTAAGIVVKASSDDTKQFALEQDTPVILSKYPTMGLNYGDLVYNYRGENIGFIKEIIHRREIIDITQPKDFYKVFAPGVLDTEITVIAQKSDRYFVYSKNDWFRNK